LPVLAKAQIGLPTNVALRWHSGKAPDMCPHGLLDTFDLGLVDVSVVSAGTNVYPGT
jgi:hypothetical protein